MVKYLSPQEVLRIHFKMVKLFGGSHGIRDLTLVESAVARPQAGFGDFEAYPDLFLKAAVLMHSLLKNHPFVDGNKRTATTSCGIFLKRNGYSVIVSQKALVKFALAVENSSLQPEKIAAWLKKHSKKIK